MSGLRGLFPTLNWVVFICGTLNECEVRRRGL
jgi:hypothetical protein